MIGPATPQMMPALEELWAACFGDDPAYVSFLFKLLQRPENMLVYADPGGVPLSMLSFRELKLRTPGEEHPAAYIYAVATAPAQRGKRLSTTLLEEADLRLAERGLHASVLVPADYKLFGFYAARGYETSFHIRRARVPATMVPESRGQCVLSPASFGRFLELRESVFGGSVLFARWDAAYLRAIGKDCAYSGGEVLGFSSGGRNGFAVCYCRGEAVVVKELAVPSGQVENALAALHRRYRAKEYVLYLRADEETALQNTLLPFGMVRWYDKEYKLRLLKESGGAAYLAHVLD